MSVSVADGVGVGDKLAVCVWLPLRDPVLVAEPDGDPVPLRVPDDVIVPVALSVPVALPVRVDDGERVRLGVSVRLPVPVCVPDCIRPALWVVLGELV